MNRSRRLPTTWACRTAFALSLAAGTLFIGCATSGATVMNAGMNAAAAKDDYDSGQKWYETQDPVKRPLWTKDAGSAADAVSEGKQAVFTVAVGGEKALKTFSDAMKGVEDAANRHVRENKDKAIAAAPLQKIERTKLYWELHRAEGGPAAKGPDRYFLVWAEYRIPLIQAESAPGKEAVRSLDARREKMKSYFATTDATRGPLTDPVPYAVNYVELLDIRAGLERLAPADADQTTILAKVNELAKTYDPTPTWFLFGKKQIDILQSLTFSPPDLDLVGKLRKEIAELVASNEELKRKIDTIQGSPSQAPAESLESIAKELDRIQAYFTRLDTKDPSPIPDGEYRVQYRALLAVEAALERTSAGDPQRDSLRDKTEELLRTHDPVDVLNKSIGAAYAGLFNLLENDAFIEQISLWRVPSKGEPNSRPKHLVMKNETLASIAKMHYDDPRYWYWIYRCNDWIKDPNVITPGSQLRILELQEELAPKNPKQKPKSR